MTQSIDVDGLILVFPTDWQCSRYDDWAFYRNQALKMRDGIKGIDLLAIDPQRTAWAIEVKDYRRHQRTKPTALPAEVALKVFDTLAMLLPAKLNASAPEEQRHAKAVCAARRLRVVLHLAQPRTHSRLWPRAINPADVQQQLRRLVKPIDAHPLVVDNASPAVAWHTR